MKTIHTFLFSICLLMIPLAAHAATSQEWSATSQGWSVRANNVNNHRFWVLRHEKYTSATITIALDPRTDLPFADSFERLKAEQAKANTCLPMAGAASKGLYDLADINKKHGYIEYRAMDDDSRPTCVLIARQYVGGGLLYSWIADQSGRLTYDWSYHADIAQDAIDDINTQDAPVAATPVAAAQASVKCEGAEQFPFWYLKWSPKTAVAYARFARFLDTEKSANTKIRIGFRLGGTFDPVKGTRDDLYYSLLVSALQGEQSLIPQKRTLTVDDRIVQEWGPGNAQWAPLSEDAMLALYAGTVAVLDTEELGAISIQISDLKTNLELVDVSQRKVSVQKSLNLCE